MADFSEILFPGVDEFLGKIDQITERIDKQMAKQKETELTALGIVDILLLVKEDGEKVVAIAPIGCGIQKGEAVTFDNGNGFDDGTVIDIVWEDINGEFMSFIKNAMNIDKPFNVIAVHRTESIAWK